MRQFLAISLVAIFWISFGSCEKRKLNRDTTTSIDISIIEGGFNDVQKVSEDVIKEESLEGKSGSNYKDIYGSPTVTVTPAWPDTTFPKDIEIDFGTGTTDFFGRVRKGIITIHATGMYKDSGSVFTITPSNYYIQDYKVEGQKTVTNNGRNSSGNINYSIEIVNGRLTTPDGDVAAWESRRNREWTAGEGTNWLSNGLSGILDDVYSITGTANGVNRLGREFDLVITSPLMVALDCQWIKKGIFELQPEDLHMRTFDYGPGSCDNEATVEINGRTYNIVMW